MKFSTFTNLRTSQMPIIDTSNTALTLLNKSYNNKNFCAVISIKMNKKEKLKKLVATYITYSRRRLPNGCI